VTVSWTQQRERGSRTLAQLMTWLTLRCGWQVGRVLLVPITAYYYVFSISSRRASRRYLDALLGRKPRRREVFRHLLTFSTTVLDRLFFLTGRLDDYEIDVIGMEHLAKWAAEGRGCILLGCHLGSFEVLRAMAEVDRLKVRPLMLDGGGPATDVLKQLNPGVAGKVIAIGQVGAMLRVKEALEAGEMVAMLGDRIAHGDKVIRTPFLGKPAAFPVGPFVISSLLAAPVILCFGLYCGARRYEIRFEPFADQLALPRGQRDQALRDYVAAFAGRVEAQCRRRPYNWFNFYDFWEEQPS
jgi:predicted LPLAT superfamily acyltransferase